MLAPSASKQSCARACARGRLFSELRSFASLRAPVLALALALIEWIERLRLRLRRQRQRALQPKKKSIMQAQVFAITRSSGCCRCCIMTGSHMPAWLVWPPRPSWRFRSSQIHRPRQSVGAHDCPASEPADSQSRSPAATADLDELGQPPPPFVGRSARVIGARASSAGATMGGAKFGQTSTSGSTPLMGAT